MSLGRGTTAGKAAESWPAGQPEVGADPAPRSWGHFHGPIRPARWQHNTHQSRETGPERSRCAPPPRESFCPAQSSGRMKAQVPHGLSEGSSPAPSVQACAAAAFEGRVMSLEGGQDQGGAQGKGLDGRGSGTATRSGRALLEATRGRSCATQGQMAGRERPPPGPTHTPVASARGMRPRRRSTDHALHTAAGPHWPVSGRSLAVRSRGAGLGAGRAHSQTNLPGMSDGSPAPHQVGMGELTYLPGREAGD